MDCPLTAKPIIFRLASVSRVFSAVLLLSTLLSESGASQTRQYAAINHPTPTNVGTPPHNSSDTGTIAIVSVATVLAGLGTYEIAEHHGKNGPDVPKAFDMDGFAIKGLARANWPVVLDFVTDSPGTVLLDIKSKAHEFQTTINSPGSGVRGYQIRYLPADFDPQPQSAIYQVRFVSTGNAPGMGLRTYGIGAGFKAVGSVAIDELTFQPAAVHPKLKEFATYGFHAHSAFDGVLADFVLVENGNGHLVVKQDANAKPGPVEEGELSTKTWDANGKAGEHMLQIKAWRGLENGGDWVVAWSPDIVDVVK